MDVSLSLDQVMEGMNFAVLDRRIFNVQRGIVANWEGEAKRRCLLTA